MNKVLGKTRFISYNTLIAIGIWIFFVILAYLVFKVITEGGDRYLYALLFILFFLWLIFVQEKVGLAIGIFVILDIVFQGYVTLGRRFLFDTVYIGISQILLILLILWVIIKRISTKEMFSIKKPFSYLWIPFIILFFIGALRSEEVREGANFFQFYALESCIIYFSALTIFKKRGDIKTFVILLLIFTILTGILTKIDYFTGETIIQSAQREKDLRDFREEGSRVGLFFINPNLAGGFWMLLLPLTLALYMYERRVSLKICLALAVLVMMGALLMTFSRGSILCLPIALLFVLGLSKAKNAKISGILIFLAAAALLWAFYGYFQAMIEDRLETTMGRIESSYEEEKRLIVWVETLELIKRHPLLGVGLGEYTFNINARRNKFRYISEYAHPHNSYLEIAVMAGIPCLFIFLLMLGRFFHFVFPALKRGENSFFHALLTGLVGGILGFLANSGTDYLYFHAPLNHLFWLFIGLSVGVVNQIMKSKEEGIKELER